MALDVIRGRTYPNDQFLLCSDGLTDMVDDDALEDVLRAQMPAQNKIERLIDLALSGGGKDNITVVLVNIEES